MPRWRWARCLSLKKYTSGKIVSTHRHGSGVRKHIRDGGMNLTSKAFFVTAPTVELETLCAAWMEVDETRKGASDQGQKWDINARQGGQG
jgi:hypothetical protein